MQSFELTETYAHGISKDVVSEKEEIEYNNIIKQCKKWLTLIMLQKNPIKKHNPNWPQIPDLPHILVIIGGSGSEK